MKKGMIQLAIRNLDIQDIKVKLLYYGEDHFIIEHSGEKRHTDEIQKGLEHHLLTTLHVDETEESGGKRTVKFRLASESPGDHIIDLLTRYEGSTPRKPEFNDD